MPSGIGEVRLYHNTTNTIPIGVYEDVSSSFEAGSLNDTAVLTKTDLLPSKTYYWWVEAIDGSLNSSGILPLGSITTSEKSYIGAGSTFPGVVITESSFFTSGVSGVEFRGDLCFEGILRANHTDGAGTMPQWVGVEFPSEVMVTTYRLWANPGATNKDSPIDWTFEGSNDGTTWSVLDTRVDSELPTTAGLGYSASTPITTSIPHGEFAVASPGYWRYYRIYATRTGGGNGDRTNVLRIGEAELLGREDVRYYAGYGGDNTGIVATSSSAALNDASDLLETNFVHFTSGAGWPQWFQYELPAAKPLRKYRFAARNGTNLKPKSWDVLGSNDGVTFDTIQQVRLADFLPAIDVTGHTSVLELEESEWHLETPNSATPYLYYRFLFDYDTTNSGVDRIGLTHAALAE